MQFSANVFLGVFIQSVEELAKQQCCSTVEYSGAPTAWLASLFCRPLPPPTIKGTWIPPVAHPFPCDYIFIQEGANWLTTPPGHPGCHGPPSFGRPWRPRRPGRQGTGMCRRSVFQRGGVKMKIHGAGWGKGGNTRDRAKKHVNWLIKKIDKSADLLHNQ